MKQYIGTKVILAAPMTRAEYNDYRGWELPADENGADEGYLVEYTDKPNQQNHPDHEGYVSWSPKEVFEGAYNDTSKGMTFGHAIEALKRGAKVAREGWNGKNMFIVYMSPLYLTADKVNDRTAKWIGEGNDLDCQPYLAMYNAQKQWIPGWLASQSDMLAEDWVIVQ